MGDPTGVGPESIAKAWLHDAVHSTCRPVVVGHPDVMRRAVQLVGSNTDVLPVDAVEDIDPNRLRMPCLTCCDNAVVHLAPAHIDALGGEAAYQSVTHACQLAIAGRIDGLVTAPLNKAALNAAGHDYPGHTELLADLCGINQVAMMLYLAPGIPSLASGGLGVAHVTLHIALRDVFRQLTQERVLETARLANGVMTAMLASRERAPRPRIGVCALNPHGGENGLFGDEETRLIEPAVQAGIAAGLDLHGPFPSDTLMARAAAGEFDAIVAMYHDQGHIALKLLAMHQAVNITLGLPVVRTSVAHGTAFDLAWKGQAKCDSMIAAIHVAAQLVRCRNRLIWQ
jgi:4-hydroxythreonine-4-phosphate dehydrogenase